MAEYIVDFQAFKDDCNNFILKEISILSVHSNVSMHCIIKSPFDLEELSSKKQREVKWLTDYHHGIKWKAGYINPDDAIQSLLDTTEDASLILSKGSERTSFLKKVTKKPILNLDEIHCPPAKFLPTVDSYFMCMLREHSMKNIRSHGYVCSVLATFQYKTWYLRYLKSYSETLLHYAKTVSDAKK